MKTIKNSLRAYLLFLLSLITGDLFAQTAKDIFSSSETPVTYLGVDFSKAKLIGDAGADAYAIKTRIFSSINQVIVNEPKNYDFNKALQKTNVVSDISVTEAQNAKVQEDSIKSFNAADFSRFNAATIDKMVKDYHYNGKTGIGMVFVVEAMSKTQEKAAVWVTFVNMANGKVLLTERMLGKAGGIGFRNYWVNPFQEIIKDIQKNKYKQWSATYR
jgi:hypothetical protein